MADEPTCGKGLADNAAVRSALAVVGGRLAGNLEVYMTAEDDMRMLLEKRAAPDREMLATIRQAIGGGSG